MDDGAYNSGIKLEKLVFKSKMHIYFKWVHASMNMGRNGGSKWHLQLHFYHCSGSKEQLKNEIKNKDPMWQHFTGKKCKTFRNTKTKESNTLKTKLKWWRVNKSTTDGKLKWDDKLRKIEWGRECEKDVGYYFLKYLDLYFVYLITTTIIK